MDGNAFKHVYVCSITIYDYKHIEINVLKSEQLNAQEHKTGFLNFAWAIYS